MDSYKQRTKLIPLNVSSQQHLESPPKHRQNSNVGILNAARRDSDFELLLKKAHYPYLSKLSLGRKRFTSQKRPEKDQRSFEQQHLQTEFQKPNASESKGNRRYKTKPVEQQQPKNTNRPHNFFRGLEYKSESKDSHPSTMKNITLNNRSYFLKKLKERYGNKQIRYSSEKSDLKISSEKVTLMHQNQSPLAEQDEHGMQTMNLADKEDQGKYQSPSDVIRLLGSRMSAYEKQEIVDFHRVWYFTEDCLQIELKQERPVQGENSVYDDKEGGFLWREKCHIAYRYELISLLGEGSFGQVFKCFDHKEGEEVAVKMVRNRVKYAKQAQIEIQILSYIKRNDPNMNKNLVLAKQEFRFRNHTCIVFQILSINLYELVKMNDYYGLPLDLIRRFSLQLLNGMHFLHRHDIIHADLKPENVLLKQANKSGLKIIDFGSSCFIKNRLYTYIQSRYYRAPEVILGIPYDFKIDIWSFACIIAELYIGYPIFPGENEKQQICLIMETMGVPSADLLEVHGVDSTRKHHYFDQQFKPLPYVNSKGKTFKPMINPLDDIIDEKDHSFCRFLKSCFQWQANLRPSALECLKHEWIIEGLPEDIRRQHLRFIEQEELILKMERRRRSPPVREMKQNESPPARARPAYFDRSKERVRKRMEGQRAPGKTDVFRTRHFHPQT